MPTHFDYDDGRAEALLHELASLTPQDRRSEEIRSQLVHMHTSFVRYIARRYARRNEPLEDVEQAAMLGLVKAINRYDPTRGERFLAYASPTMTGEVKRHFRDRTWTMRMPRRLQELRLALHAAREDFSREHGRAPTIREVSELLDISDEEAIEALNASDAYHPVSLDAPVTDQEGTDTLADLIGDEDPDIETVVDRNAVRPLLDQLPPRERAILLHRFFGNKTQSEIADLMHLSQMHVSRLISRSLTLLRAQLLEEG
jgi:RNA polymerase sigma-B factor